jgi:hypothetical protein
MALPADVAALPISRNVTGDATTKGAAIVYVMEQQYTSPTEPSYELSDYYDTTAKEFVLSETQYACLGNTTEDPFSLNYNVNKEPQKNGFKEAVDYTIEQEYEISGLNLIEMADGKLEKALDVLSRNKFPYLVIRYKDSNDSEPADVYFIYKGNMGGWTSSVGSKTLLTASDISITGLKVPGKNTPYERATLV